MMVILKPLFVQSNCVRATKRNFIGHEVTAIYEFAYGKLVVSLRETVFYI